MGEVIGYLRPDKATYGEELVLQTLQASLPSDFIIYVECPLHDGRLERFPDFIVLANYGVVVLEVKDWVQIVEIDKYHARIRDRGNRTRRERNPVHVARDYALLLADELQKVPELLRDNRKLRVPWGYAAVFPNLPPSVLTQLRSVWGEPFVLGEADLGQPVVTRRLKATIPFDVTLRRHEIQAAKAVINPSVVIVPEDKDKPVIILDDDQERLVAEAPRAMPPRVEEKPAATIEQKALEELFEAAAAPMAAEPVPEDIGEQLALNASIRLVRGVAGSGKTLILTRRAQYLAAQHPDWRIAVLTYNDALVRALRPKLRGSKNVEVRTFHSLCRQILKPQLGWKDPCDPVGWLNHHLQEWPVAQKLGVDFVSEEIKWIKEVGIKGRTAYLEATRKGRGQALQKAWREQILDVLEAYELWLEKQKSFDWADVPHLALQALDQGLVTPEPFDAILIDEAQDFAPVWLQVVRRLLKPEWGVLFMADDPSQSIYRFYSWAEKGIPVVGRTRWLRIPYRNTREIYRAAYEVIREDQILQRQLEGQTGLALSEPDLTSRHLRSGPRPVVRGFSSADDEFRFVRAEIEGLLQQGYHADEIAVLHRRRPGVRKLKDHLRGLDVTVSTFHALKGLEFEVVFLSQMQETFARGEQATEEELSEERRLVYMAMTRGREHLYLNYEAHWPQPLKGVLDFVDHVPC